MINVAKEMEHLHKLAGNNQAKRFTDLWESLTSEEWLAQAWEEIRRNIGSRTPGIDKETAEDIDLTRIHHLSRKLHDGLNRSSRQTFYRAHMDFARDIAHIRLSEMSPVCIRVSHGW